MTFKASDFLELELLDHVFGGSDYTAPANVFPALFVQDSGVAIDSVTNATNTINEAAHGKSVGDAIFLSNSGGALPTGLFNNIRYFLVNVNAGDFQLALTPGGSVVTFSDDGTGTHSYHVGNTDAGGGNEVTGGSYARPSITNDATNWPAASGGTKQNGTLQSFVSASALWGNGIEMAYFDAVTAGNMLFYTALDTVRNIVSGNTASFPINNITINFTTVDMFDYLRNELIDHVFSAAAFTRPATVYLALLTATPTSSDTGSTITEPSGNNYARLSITNDATNFPAAASGNKNNGVLFQMATPSGSWGTPTDWALIDAVTAGNALVWGQIDTPQAITTDDDVQWQIGDLDINMN